ncbi:hypothetical protein DR864_27175 [Runella rosea]|uniref:Uncharacterized protein n=2 Tax=Runella rosea TaxID=2259595 RepID=A0A344TR84_9BACT|nr:hypothetical protein DR864_27175 [Runella rosea]
MQVTFSRSTFSYLLLFAFGIGFGIGLFLGWKSKPAPSAKQSFADTAFHVSENRYLQKVDSLQFELRQKDETIIDLREQMALDSVRRMSELEAMRTINERYRRR